MGFFLSTMERNFMLPGCLLMAVPLPNLLLRTDTHYGPWNIHERREDIRTSGEKLYTYPFDENVIRQRQAIE